MRAYQAPGIFDQVELEFGAVALSTYSGDKFLGVQPRVFGGKDGTAAPYEAMANFGIYSRPLDPDVDQDGLVKKGCTMLLAHDGDDGFCMVLTDPRVVASLPPLAKGSTLFYGMTSETDATKPVSVMMIDSSAKGSWSVLVPHDGGTTSSTIAVDVHTVGSEQITLRHGLGMGVTIAAGGMNPVAINNKAGDAFLSVDDEGITLSGPKLALNGSVLIGDPAAAMPLALGPTLVALLTQLNAAVAQMATIVGAVTTPAQVPGLAAVAPIAGQVTAITAQLATILSTKAYAT